MDKLRDRAILADSTDSLAGIRKKFLLPDGVVYLDGNSLGALYSGVPERVARGVSGEWGRHLIRAWNDAGWWQAPLRIGDRIGRLVGAAPGQTVVGESTSVQIFNALMAAIRLRPGRRILVTDSAHFPTDRYLAASVGRLLGVEVLEVPVDRLGDVLRERGEQVAAIAYGAVDYRTGELWDITGITRQAHRAGAVTVWDLCHAVGAVPMHLDHDEVDLAVGCTYKYLSGGPGSPAFLYVAARHQEAFDHPVTGWHGHARPFAMEDVFVPAAGISRARVATPPVLSLLALDAALDAFDGVGIDDIRAKNVSLGEFFLDCADVLLEGLGFEVASPRQAERRGSHVSLSHPDAHPLMACLIDRGIVGDVRPPGLLRFGFNSLYTSYEDIHRALDTLRSVAVSGEHRDARFQVRKPVS
jgi:kynureninase